MVSWLIADDFQHLLKRLQLTFRPAPSPHNLQVQCGPKGRDGIQDERCCAISAYVARIGGDPRCPDGGFSGFFIGAQNLMRCEWDDEGNEVNANVYDNYDTYITSHHHIISVYFSVVWGVTRFRLVFKTVVSRWGR